MNTSPTYPLLIDLKDYVSLPCVPGMTMRAKERTKPAPKDMT